MPDRDIIYILDSSFFLSGFQPPDGKLVTTDQVVEEIGSDRKELQFVRSRGLRIQSPSPSALDKVLKQAQETGDDSRMSETDIALVALALELDGVLVTDDYSMQNTANIMKIPYHSIAQKGITRLEKWYHRCAYCGIYLEKKYPDCPTCGGPVRTTRRPPGTGKRKKKKRRAMEP